jgi:hypothetical protein
MLIKCKDCGLEMFEFYNLSSLVRTVENSQLVFSLEKLDILSLECLMLIVCFVILWMSKNKANYCEFKYNRGCVMSHVNP